MAKLAAASSPIALFLTLNILFFTMVSSINYYPTVTGKCPTDSSKYEVCGDLLNDLVHLNLGSQAKTKCCSLIQGIAGADFAYCLCDAIKTNSTSILPLDALSLLFNNCGKNRPWDFRCP
ncbi:PREDICTED: putative lipid-binding protein AIR1 [Nicotiana attenuata]|uniref:14 kDa proline-rich protein dc2.15 n=1 Tax=Nicotiana attenuata TaxID=49451 RepID=A0A1J6ISI9_NICAT|nr:PREDICTED: putative lipid-binding protein AIR1 [Nicotiana attenuata]OIT07690.1 14 kda proline-rich protein dc2.15 [Nicotiana attenuata]